MPALRDPRQDPEAGDRVLIRSEGTPRIVVEIQGALYERKVVWRWLGGTVRRTSTLAEWRQQMEAAHPFWG
jgi:hypothetical protein